MTHYDTLNLTKDASSEQIKQSYRKLALLYHPDRNNSEDAAKKFKEIAKAFEVLSDPHKKFVYDQRLPSAAADEEAARKEAREFFKDAKEVKNELHTPIANGKPPTHDLWGRRLTPQEQQQWMDDLKTDPRRYKRPKQQGEFWDAYANMYEGGGSMDIR